MTQDEQDFQRALKLVLVYEGGFSDDPADPGGATMQGVTQVVYNDYRARHRRPSQSVRLITAAEVQDIYRSLYWLPVTPGRVWPLNAALFDTAVNMGVSRALQLLDQAKQTPANTAPNRMHALALKVLDLREQNYRDIVRARPVMGKFLTGWLNRLGSLRREIGV